MFGYPTEMMEKIINFEKNGGRFHKDEEPKYGEPFYGEYMSQYISKNYHPGDKVRITASKELYEGIIISVSYYLKLLVSGRKVHKDKRNKKEFSYRDIQSIELIKGKDDVFDLAVVDPDEWKFQNEKDNTFRMSHEKTEHRRNIRNHDQEVFNIAYPDVVFDISHVIQINDGCSLYWPFENDGISAEVFMVRDNNKITKIPCKTGTPFPNKNSYHAYNCKQKDRYPDMYLYLPDNGFVYEDVNIVCVWSINMKDTVVKLVDIHHIGKIKPIKEERNQIFIDMNTCPLLGYGNSLFTEQRNSSLLERMMDYDMYFVLNLAEDDAIIVKKQETQEEKEINKYTFMALMAANGFNVENTLKNLITTDYLPFPIVEVFCDIDDEPVRYYSSAWRHCRKGYEFKMLGDGSQSNE